MALLLQNLPFSILEPLATGGCQTRGDAFLKSHARLSNPQSNDGAAHDLKAYDQRLPLNLFARLHLPLAPRLKNVLAAKQILQIACLGVHHAFSALLDPLIRALGSIVKRPEQFIPRHF